MTSRPLHADPDTAIVFTTRMEALADFYRQALDLGEPETAPGHMGFQLPSLYLGFDQVEEAHGAGSLTLWFRVDDLDACYERCLSLGATSHYAPVEKPWGDRLAAVRDPDGNLVGLSQRQPAPAG